MGIRVRDGCRAMGEVFRVLMGEVWFFADTHAFVNTLVCLDLLLEGPRT